MDFDNQNSFDFVGSSQTVDDIDGFDPIPQQFEQQPEEEVIETDDAFGLGFDNNNTSPQASSPMNIFDMPQNAVPEPSPQSISTPAKSSAKQQWDEKKAKQLKERAEKQKQQHQQNVVNGKKELAGFQEKRRTTTDKTKSANRSEETESRTELEGTLKNGTEWEKVSKYCNLKAKHDPKIAQQPNNTERMRSLIIDLKNEKK